MADDEPQAPRPPSPPPHTTFAARGIHAPNFAAFRPRDIRIPAAHAVQHVAWSCDGRRLAAVGIDKNTRVWQPDKSIDVRASQVFGGSAHTDEVDHVAWSPAHADLFCTSSQRDRRLVFWDARQPRPTQTVQLKFSPMQAAYAPDGRALAVTSTSHLLYFLALGREPDEPKDAWRLADARPVPGSTALFNHAGTGVVHAHHHEPSVLLSPYPPAPGGAPAERIPTHVLGCAALALDPRGRYLATGGHDTVVNLFDTAEWICARTITGCDDPVTALSFSHDGEYLAVASTGPHIDIFATETGASLHRVPALSASAASTWHPSPAVAWHPSKHVVAYCGFARAAREGGPPSAAIVGLFGPGM